MGVRAKFILPDGTEVLTEKSDGNALCFTKGGQFFRCPQAGKARLADSYSGDIPRTPLQWISFMAGGAKAKAYKWCHSEKSQYFPRVSF